MKDSGKQNVNDNNCVIIKKNVRYYVEFERRPKMTIVLVDGQHTTIG
jgi:hypothetical protein